MKKKPRPTRRAQKTASSAPEPIVENPYAVLGIPPTLSVTAIKRAYFSALPKVPPDRDPEGFRRLRVAYESLAGPRGPLAAFVSHPVDFAAAHAMYAARFDEPLSAAAAQSRAAEVATPPEAEIDPAPAAAPTSATATATATATAAPTSAPTSATAPSSAELLAWLPSLSFSDALRLFKNPTS